MESLQDFKILRFHPDTLQAVRKEFGLDNPERLQEAIVLLDDWVKKQEHFIKKDFSRNYLERLIITCKGSVERSKQRLDKLCTFKTLMPNFFQDTDVRKLSQRFSNYMTIAPLPNLTNNNYRVFVMKLNSENLDSSMVFDFYKMTIVLKEFSKKYEYCCGFYIIIDLTEINILNTITKFNPIKLKQVMTLLMEGYGMRIRGIHIITPSKTVDMVISLFKQVVSAKIANRIQVHRSVETLYEYVPKYILPVDFGGEEIDLKTLNEEWINVVSSEEFTEYLREMNRAATNEKYRRADEFNEQYLGTPGSFRNMNVD